MPLRYDGHRCYHELLHMTTSREHSVGWIKETMPTVEEIECYISLFNPKPYGHIRDIIQEYPNIKKVTLIKDKIYPIDFLHPTDLNTARRHIREIKRDFNDVIELVIDPAILDSSIKNMQLSDFDKVIEKTSGLAWQKHRLEDEILDPDDPLNIYNIHVTLLPWIYGALHRYDEKFTEEMYIKLLHDNVKSFEWS